MALLNLLIERFGRRLGPVQPSAARSRQLGFIGAKRALLGGGKKFTPLSTFAQTGANGFWLDESDYNALFQDSTGATPVTAVEQQLGLVLDKRLGLARGAELFTSFAAATAANANGTVVASAPSVACTCTVNGVFGASIGISAVGGTPYEATISWTGNSAGLSLYADVGSGAGTTFLLGTSASGSKRAIVFPVASGGLLLTAIAGLVGNTVTFNAASVRSVPGNHALQATAANRPVGSARVNLLTKTEQFDDASWSKTLNGGAAAPVVTANQAIAPDGTLTADLIVFSAGPNTVSDYSTLEGPLVSVPVARLVPFSVWLKTSDGSTQTITQSIAGAAATTQTVNGTWQRYSMAWNASVDNWGPRLVCGGGATGGSASLHVWGAQVEMAATVTRYQRVNTATDYDTAGFPIYLSFNGTNTNLATTTGGGGTAGFFFCQAIAPLGRGAPLATPVNAAFSTAITGGTLAARTYGYRVAAKNAYGSTLASTETTIVTTGTTSANTVNWGAVSGATSGYDIFGRTVGGELLIGSVAAGVTTFVDNGSVTPAGALPAANTTAYEVLFSDAGTNTGYKVVTNSAGNLLLQAGNGTTYTTATSTDVLAIGSAALITLWDDGTNLNAQVGSGTVFSVPRPVISAGTAAVTIGSDNGAATGFFNGNLYPEVYFKDTGLTAAQRLQNQNYCKSKAGL